MPTLTLDATPGGNASNSYASVADATSYAAFRLGASAWTDLPTAAKVQLLVMATRAINALNWSLHVPGEPTRATQALEWPRNGATTLPRKLIEATIELALSLIPAVAAADDPDAVNALVAPVVSNIKRDKVGPLETEYFAPTDDQFALAAFPPIVQRLLLGLLMIPTALTTLTYGTGAARRTS